MPATSHCELESVFQLDLTTFLLTCGLAKEHRGAISEGRALGTLGVLKPNKDILHITKGLCCCAVAEQGLCSFLGILITSWSCFRSLSVQGDPASLFFNQPAFNWCFFPGSKQAGAHSVRLCPACVSLHVSGHKGLQSTLLKNGTVNLRHLSFCKDAGNGCAWGTHGPERSVLIAEDRQVDCKFQLPVEVISLQGTGSTCERPERGFSSNSRSLKN